MSYAGLGAYNRVAIAIDSKEMVLVKLLSGSVRFISFARNGLEMGNARIKGESISRVIDILTELDCALDREMGGELVQNLSALYRYMMYRLTIANLRNDATILDEVEDILKKILEGFEGAAGKTSATGSTGSSAYTANGMSKGVRIAA